jgi:3-dehydroquinate synthase
LPTAWPAGLAPEDVLEVMKRDKKGQSGKLVLVLPRGIGRVEIVKQVDERLVLEVMRASQGGDE